MNPASNLILVGPMGAGKTCVGRRVAAHFSLPFFDADGEIEQRAGASVTGIFEREGETGFRARERAALAEVLSGHDGVLLATGGGAILDADNRRMLRESGFVVHLHVGVEHQLLRLAHDRTRPLLGRDDRERERVLQDMASDRARFYAEVADLSFDTDRLTAAEAAARLAGLLEQRWQRPAVASPRLDEGVG